MKGQINLLPRAYIQKQKFQKYAYLIGISIVMECVLFVTMIIVPSKYKLKMQQKELIALQEQLVIPEYTAVHEAEAALNQAKENLKLWEEKYHKLNDVNAIDISTLDCLTSKLPANVGIDQLTITTSDAQNQSSINIEGSSMDHEGIFNYVTNLENIYGSQSVSFTILPTINHKEGLKYSMTIYEAISDTVAVEEPLYEADENDEEGTRYALD